MSENEAAIRQYLELSHRARKQAPDVWWQTYDALCETVQSLRRELDELWQQEHPYRGNLTVVSVELHVLIGSSTDEARQAETRRELAAYGIDPETIEQRISDAIQNLMAQVLPLLQSALTSVTSAPDPADQVHTHS